jgi:hypothetical protein
VTAALPLDLDLHDLEEARDEAGEAILDLLEALPSCGPMQGELTEVVHKISSVRSSLIRAIDACTDPQVDEREAVPS